MQYSVCRRIDRTYVHVACYYHVYFERVPNILSRAWDIGGLRDSRSDVIFAHAHIRGRQWYGQLYGICVKCGFIF